LDNKTVTFSVSQPWTNETLCVLSTYYQSGNGQYECPTAVNVGFGWSNEYTAECIDGEAIVDLYIHDESFDERPDIGFDIPCECPVMNGGLQTEKWTYTLPCPRSDSEVSKDCPVPEQKGCTHLTNKTIGYDDFENVASVKSYVDGHEASYGSGKYLFLNGSFVEVYKKYSVPVGSESIEIKFDVIFPIASQLRAEVFARVGNYDIPIEANRSGYAGSASNGSIAIYGEIGSAQQVDNDFERLNVFLAVPSNVFSKHSVTFGLRMGEMDSGARAGLDNVEIVVVCESECTEAPTGAPTVSPTPTPTPSVEITTLSHPPTKTPTQVPTFATPTTNPSQMPIERTAFPTACPLYEAAFKENESKFNKDPLAPPIDIISLDNKTVTFSVSQSWTNETVCVLSTYYQSSNDGQFVCPSAVKVGFGWSNEYTAECIDGEANVVLYIHDESFAVWSDVGFDIPCECPVMNGGLQTEKWTYTLPCSMTDSGHSEECPIPVLEDCTHMENKTIGYDDFESTESVESFVDGHDAPYGAGKYLLLNASVVEIYKKYSVPVGSESIEIDFDVIFPASLQLRADAFVRIGNFDIPIEESRSGYARSSSNGDISIYGETGSAEEVDVGFVQLHVFLAVPSTAFSNHSLTFGLRLGQLDSEGASAGLDNVKIVVVCESECTEAPSGAPTPPYELTTPTWTPTASPTFTSQVPTLVPTKSVSVYPTTLSCPEISEDGPINPFRPLEMPISIISTTYEDYVTFEISQLWTNDTLCGLSVYYDDINENKSCPTSLNVGPMDSSIHSAVCLDGVATVSVFVYYPNLTDGSEVTIPLQCTPLHSLKAKQYTYKLPCRLEPCEPIEEQCNGPVTRTTGDWKYLESSDSKNMTARSYILPKETGSVVVEFTIDEQSTGDLTVLVHDAALPFGSFDPYSPRAFDHVFEDIKVTVACSEDSQCAVTMAVPESMFNEVLFLGFETDGALVISNIEIYAICQSSCPVIVTEGSGTAESITVLDVNVENVTIAVSQLWTDSICQLMVSHSTACPTFYRVPAGDLPETFTVQCDYTGFARGVVYAFDSIFNEILLEVCEKCPANAVGGYGTAIKFAIPCNPDCPPNQPVDWSIMNIDSLLFATPDATTDGETVLRIESDIESAVTVEIPPSALHLELKFDLFELSSPPSKGKFMFRLGNNLFTLFSLDSTKEDAVSRKEHQAENVHFEFVSSGPTENHVTIDIPVHEFAVMNRLTFGIVSTGGIDIGVSNLILTVYSACPAVSTTTTITTTFNDPFDKHGWTGDVTTFPIHWNVQGTNYSHALGRFGMETGEIEKVLNVGDIPNLALFEMVIAVHGSGIEVMLEVDSEPFSLELGQDVDQVVGRHGRGGFGVLVSLSYEDSEYGDTEYGLTAYRVSISLHVDHSKGDDTVAIILRYLQTSNVNSWFAILSTSLSAQCTSTGKRLLQDGPNSNGPALSSSSSSSVTLASATTTVESAAAAAAAVDDNNNKSSFYCVARDYPCEGGTDFVNVCHYSARLGYQTFCIPEADSEVLRFYSKDYCGPCVGSGSFGGSSILA
jgi:hypothetical protein